MKLKFKGSLADENGKPLANLMIRGCNYSNTGRLVSRASGKTSANGGFILSPRVEFPNTMLPRIAVQILHKNRWLMLTDQPKSFSSGTVDFGKILFHETQLYKISTVPYHGDNHTVTLATPLIVRHSAQPIRFVGSTGTVSKPTVNVASVEKLNTEVATLKRTNLDLTKERDSAKAELAGKQNLIRLKDQEIARVHTDLNKAHSAKIADKEVLIKKLENENKAFKKATPERVNIDEIALSTGTQIEDVQRQLSATNSSLRLSKVSFQVKGVADPSGKAMVLPARKDIPQLAGGLSTLNLDYSPRVTGKPRTSKVPDEPVSQKIESYLSQTEASARRQLEALSIPYRIYQQPLTSGDMTNLGRVIHQSPAAGSLLEEDTVIKLIVGKASAQ